MSERNAESHKMKGQAPEVLNVHLQICSVSSSDNSHVFTAVSHTLSCQACLAKAEVLDSGSVYHTKVPLKPSRDKLVQWDRIIKL